ncbi:MAG: Ig-like domain-containing protein [Flavisolibacter sp.]
MKKLLIISLLVLIWGCKKSDELPPVITMISPLQNYTTAGGQTIQVKATITDNEGIHKVHAICVDDQGGHMLHFEEHFDGKSYSLNQSFPTISGKKYTLTIEAHDHADNVTTKVIEITTN